MKIEEMIVTTGGAGEFSHAPDGKDPWSITSMIIIGGVEGQDCIGDIPNPSFGSDIPNNH